MWTGLPAEGDLARGAAVQPHQGPRDLGPPGADQAEEGQHLARVQRRR